MQSSINDLYQTLLDQHRTVALQCLDDQIHCDRFTRCHNFLADLEKISIVVEGRPEKACLISAVNEYQYALGAILTGQYRHGFASLRLTTELLISAIYFSGHELSLRQWENASKDISWSALMDEDNGVFSAAFVKAFHPFLGELRMKYRSLAMVMYRECSEFVHGNPKRTRPLEGAVQFKPELLEQWEQAVESLRLFCVYLFLLRYVDFSTAGGKALLEQLATDNIWHEEQVRACFERD